MLWFIINEGRDFIDNTMKYPQPQTTSNFLRGREQLVDVCYDRLTGRDASDIDSIAVNLISSMISQKGMVYPRNWWFPYLWWLLLDG